MYYVSQPGFSRIVPRVLVSCISRLNTHPKCSPIVRMLNAPPGLVSGASMGISPPPGSVDNQQVESMKVTNRETRSTEHVCWVVS